MIYTIKVNYKSGISETFDVTEFSIEGGKWTWNPADPNHTPLLLNISEVESVWQLACKEPIDEL